MKKLLEVFRTFLLLGCTSFGGPIAHLGYFRKAFVEEKQWLNENQFGQLLAICQFLPGPASSQLGFLIGLQRAGWLGALLAFIAFTLPSAMLMIGFAWVMPALSSDVGQAIIHGLKIVALVVVADAVLGMLNNLCPDHRRRWIAVAAAASLLLVGFAWFQLIVIILGAVLGFFLCRQQNAQPTDRMTISYGKRLGFVLIGLFTLCLFALPSAVTENADAVNVASIFYQAGALVFGGGHVVLPLLDESVVQTQMVSSETFLAGYGVAQAIPGPLFTFAGYLGATIPLESSAEGHPIVFALIALLFMFLPGFLLAAGALPFWQVVAHSPKAIGAVAGVNAAVVGVLGAALYDPIFISSITQSSDLVVAIVGLTLLRAMKLSPLWIVLWCVSSMTLLSQLH